MRLNGAATHSQQMSPQSPPALMQHAPWIGEEFQTNGFDGQRIAIVGYSHHGAETYDEDYAEVTTEVVQSVVDGSSNLNFFSYIRNYFGLRRHSELWNRVTFFNYLPRCIGGRDAGFNEGSIESHEEGRQRFFRIIGENRPEKVILFSAKAWEKGRLPDFTSVMPFDTSGIDGAVCNNPCGVYESKDCVFLMLGLRHPQGAPGAQMALAIQRFLKLQH